MSVCGQNGPVEDDSASEEVCAPNRDLYKQKPASKVVRVLTVLAYLLFVSLAAILLSVYYVCVWKSPELPPESAPELSARRSHDHHYDAKETHRHHHHRHIPALGGGDITINGTSPPPLSDNSTSVSPSTEGETAEPTHTLPTQEYNTIDDIGVFSDTNHTTNNT